MEFSGILMGVKNWMEILLVFSYNHKKILIDKEDFGK